MSPLKAARYKLAAFGRKDGRQWHEKRLRLKEKIAFPLNPSNLENYFTHKKIQLQSWTLFVAKICDKLDFGKIQRKEFLYKNIFQVHFSIFSTSTTFLHQINLKSCPTWIRNQDSNSQSPIHQNLKRAVAFVKHFTLHHDAISKEWLIS